MPLFAALQAAFKDISRLVQRAAITGSTGLATGGGENAGGEQQKKLDIVSNDLLKGFLARSGVVRVLASEEVGLGRCVPGALYCTPCSYNIVLPSIPGSLESHTRVVQCNEHNA